MMHALMPPKTSPKTSTQAPKARPRRKPEPPELRKNALVEAASDAQRTVLLKALRENSWNLTLTAESLRLHGPSAVIRYIHALGLGDEYEAARSRGAVKQGRPAGE